MRRSQSPVRGRYQRAREKVGKELCCFTGNRCMRIALSLDFNLRISLSDVNLISSLAIFEVLPSDSPGQKKTVFGRYLHGGIVRSKYIPRLASLDLDPFCPWRLGEFSLPVAIFSSRAILHRSSPAYFLQVLHVCHLCQGEMHW